MSNIRLEMPVLARHAGEWVGTYTLVDITGKIIDQHQSHLSCQFPENSPYHYYQINRYTWENGKTEEHQFPATYQDQKIWFDTERIQGKAWEIDEATVILWFAYKQVPDMYLYEMIQISPDNNHRARTWHWFKNHQIYQRTLIQEKRVG
ncbi:hypothetical protein B6N60_03082 [Richelia sinica FACHB-800]|uniref:DUF3598 domain-containing protein n=1 Tax=Richelia sinica FACHB-800 TaxID=1357546 RepID=A0A975TAB7_9NOST|nr:DUF3598 family protein [Richelia sinica]MBD2663224.1 DUF3598 family protein [Richelia sinica FACHB-800]QXE24377.1 hypothetical protein B6N60_03082 [Richelia sinica FACHB-800]